MNALLLRLLRVVSRERWGTAFVGGGDLEAVGIEFVNLFQRFGLQPHHDVLDIGCGVGRMAIPLSRFITSGSYVGIDVSADAIELCRKRAKRENFAFVHADLYNSLYNKSGQRAADYRFPFPKRSFDFVVLCSVFTHMVRDEVENYLAEIARLMRDDGVCFITWFVIDGPLPAPSIAFEPFDSVSFVRKRRVPAAAVAYKADYVMELYARNRLRPSLHVGTWARPRGLTFQDVVVARKDQS
jgi:SAM-dependent methyltransferase